MTKQIGSKEGKENRENSRNEDFKNLGIAARNE